MSCRIPHSSRRLEGRSANDIAAHVGSLYGPDSERVNATVPADGPRIHYPNERESLGRSRGTRSGAIPAGEQRGNPFRLLCASADLYDSPDEIADHVVEKAIRRDQDHQLRLPRQHAGGAHLTDRSAATSGRGTERREIVLASHEAERFCHRGPIEISRHMPGKPTKE